MKQEKILITQIEETFNSEKKSLNKERTELKERKITKFILSNNYNDETFNILDKEHDLDKVKSYYIDQISETKKQLNILHHLKIDKQKMIRDMDEKIQSEIASSSKLEMSKLQEYYENEVHLMESKLKTESEFDLNAYRSKEKEFYRENVRLKKLSEKLQKEVEYNGRRLAEYKIISFEQKSSSKINNDLISKIKKYESLMEEKYKRDYSKNGNILNDLDYSVLRIRTEIQDKESLLTEMESEYKYKTIYYNSQKKKIKRLKKDNISIKRYIMNIQKSLFLILGTKNSMNKKVKRIEDLVKHYDETKIKYEGYLLMFNKMNQEVVFLENDLRELKDEVERIKIKIQEKSRFNEQAKLNIDEIIFKINKQINETRNANEISESKRNVLVYFINTILKNLFDKYSKLDKIYTKLSQKNDGNKSVFSQKRLVSFFEEKICNNFEVTNEKLQSIFKTFLKFQHLFLYFFNRHLCKFIYSNSFQEKMKILDFSELKDTSRSSIEKQFSKDKINSLRKKTDITIQKAHKLELETKSWDINEGLPILNSKIKKSVQATRSSKADEKKNCSLKEVNDIESLIIKSEENNAAETKREKELKNNVIKLNNSNKRIFNRLNDIHKLQIALFNPKNKKNISQVSDEVSKKLRYEESKLKTHLHFEKKENQLNKFTIENESKREDPISTKNAGNILITTNYTENLNSSSRNFKSTIIKIDQQNSDAFIQRKSLVNKMNKLKQKQMYLESLFNNNYLDSNEKELSIYKKQMLSTTGVENLSFPNSSKSLQNKNYLLNKQIIRENE